MLQELALQTEYRSGECDLVESFYRPCLERSVAYDRAVGYFRSSVAAVYGPAIIGFARRGGRIRLVCSTDLNAEDVQAASSENAAAERILTTKLLRDLDELLADPESCDRLRVVATLVALKTLEISVAIPRYTNGIFHEKLGIFVDANDDAVSFKGSSNETWSGWHPSGNIESNEVFCSWGSETEAVRVSRHREYFERLWTGKVPSTRVLKLPAAVREKLIQYRNDSLDLLGTSTSSAPRGREKLILRPHQENALAAWHANGKRGILAHATGSGKTITALTAIKEHCAVGFPALVVVPSQILVDQWIDEAKKVLEDPVILCAGAGHDAWREGTRLRSMTSPAQHIGCRLIIATMKTACSEDFRARIHGGDHLFLIGDEVHQLGAPEMSKALQIASGPRLGLSATPTRYGDPEGTDTILDYFGAILEPPFTLRDAIASGVLCEYSYYPHIVRLSEEESDEWRELTVQIGRELGRVDKAQTNLPLSDRAKLLLIKRFRIAKKAQSKVNLALEIVGTHYEKGQRWLIYCEDIDQLEEILSRIRSLLPACSEYHSKMTADRHATLEWFESSGGVLVSIACLDEGVDIPAASHALILASSQNPRQFVQRRGRVLRKAPGKHFAEIHDALVAPISVQDEPSQTALLEAELARALKFAEDAMNTSALVTIRQAIASAGVDPDSIMNTGLED